VLVPAIVLAVTAFALDGMATEYHGRSVERIYHELESAESDEVAASKIGRADAILVVRPDGSVLIVLPPPRLAWRTYLDRFVVDYETYRIEIRSDPSTGRRLVRMRHGSE
jgi:hypothetical protein